MLVVNFIEQFYEYYFYKDFVKYDFFQIFFIVGGFFLLVNSGFGQFSIDEKKKVYQIYCEMFCY